MSNKSSLITEQPIGASQLSSYPGQTPCSTVQAVQARVHRKCDAARCGEKACEIPLWPTKPQCAQVTQQTSSPQLHLHLYEQYLNKES